MHSNLGQNQFIKISAGVDMAEFQSRSTQLNFVHCRLSRLSAGVDSAEFRLYSAKFWLLTWLNLIDFLVGFRIPVGANSIDFDRSSAGDNLIEFRL